MKFSGERFIPNETDRDIKIEHLHRYYAITDLVRGKSILDAASGEGYGSYILSQYAYHVTGLDLSAEAIVHSKLTYAKDNISFVQGSIDELPIPDNSIDVVVSFETIEHVNEETQHRFLQEIKRVLKPNGLLVISTPDKYIYSERANYRNPYHVHEFDKEEFYHFLRYYFSEIDIYSQVFEISSLMLNNRMDQVKRIHIESNDYIKNGKYMVAVCSDESLSNINLNSFVPEHQDKYFEIIQRIIALQDEVEERNVHIKHLDDVVLSKDQHIVQIDEKNKYLQGQLEHQSKTTDDTLSLLNQNMNIINSLQSQLKENSEKLFDVLQRLAVQEEVVNRLREELKAKEEIIESMDDLHIQINTKVNEYNEHNKNLGTGLLEKDQIIQNQLGHINMLLEQERKLNNILHSGGWRALTKYYRFRDMILPENSKRKLIAKMTYKTLKNPKQIVKRINKDNIKKLKYYLKTEDPSLVESRIENYLERHTEGKHIGIQTYQNIDTSQKLVFPIFDTPLVSIIIPVYNQWEYTYACLKSILDNTNDVAYEVIVADDMSSDETIHIQDKVKNINVIRDGINRGFLLNCNHAAGYANGKYLFFLNNDTNVQTEWLSSLLSLIEKDETIGMVGSKLVYPDGRQQEAGGIIWNDASGWNYGRLDDPTKPEYNYVKEVDYISGAAIMIRAELWTKIGGFDERYVPAYFEDSDLAFEVRKHGYKVMFQPKSVVVHFEGISHGTDVSSGVKSYQVANKEKFINKWSTILQRDHFLNSEHVYFARDRSKEKRTILIIDHYVPHYDKDAGSRTVYQYIRLFVELGMNVKFLGDNFFKHEPYASDLEQMGVEVFYGKWYADNFKEWIRKNGTYIDFTYLNRPHISTKYIDLIRKYTNSKVFYYGHDLHYLRELREYALSRNEELLKSAEHWRKVEYELIHKSDVIYYPSQVEVDELKKQFPDSLIKAIPAYIFEDVQVRDSFLPIAERQDLLFVGGFGHKPNVDAVLWFAEEIFPNVLKALPTIKWFVVGSNPPDVIRKLQSDNIIVTGYVSDEELQQYYKKSRLVVVPLRFGAGVKGKVVEAMYYGMPIITTSVGSEGLPEADEYLVKCDECRNFAKIIVEMYFDEQKLTQLSEKSRKFVSKFYSKESVLSMIEQDFMIQEKRKDQKNVD